MKKIISKLALVSVAMAGLFTSCQIENIRTTFDLAEASYTINVKAYYALTGEEITNLCTIASPFASGASFTVPTTNKGIAAQTIQVTATFTKSGETLTKPFDIPTVNPGGVGTGTLEFWFGSTDDEEYSVVLVDESSETVVGELQATHYAHFSHADGSVWNTNDSEFILSGEAQYELWTGAKVSDIKSVDPKYASEVEPRAQNYANPAFSQTTETLKFQVSAWAAYRVWAERVIKTENYNVVKKNTVMETEEVVGSFVRTSYTSTVAQFAEEACPGHEAHYTHGHGTHDIHGGHNNAGGGIVYGE